MKPTFFQRAWPTLAVLGVFLALTMAYFSPMLNGKLLRQGDMEHVAGMQREGKDFQQETGEVSVWTGSMFSGMPSYQIYAPRTSNLVSQIQNAFLTVFPQPLGIALLYLIGFFFLGATLGLPTLLSAAMAIGFAFGSYNFIILEAGHPTKALAIAYMPLVMGGLLQLFRGNWWLGASVTALGLALELTANHFQITYYLMFVVLAFGIAKLIEAVREKELLRFAKAVAIAVGCLALAVGANFSNLWTTQEYAAATIRGKAEIKTDATDETKDGDGLKKDYAFGWSYGVGESWTVLVPNAYGGGSGTKLENKSATYKWIENNGAMSQLGGILDRAPTYWGDQPFTSGPVYLGALVCFLFVFGFFATKGSDRWWLLAASVLSFMLAWGKNFEGFNDFMFYNVPLYNKFRSVSMTLVIASLCFPILGALGLARLMAQDEESKKRNEQALKIAAGVVGGLLLLVCLMPSLLGDFSAEGDKQMASLPKEFLDAFREDRMSMARADALRSLLFVVLGGALLWFTVKGRVKTTYAYAGLGLLILIDLWGIDQRYLSKENFVPKSETITPYFASQADEQILADKDPHFRVFNTVVNSFNDASTSFFHKSVGGYHAAKLRRYQDVIEMHLSRGNMAVFNMLNTKYFIQQGQGGQPAAAPNPAAMGNAWVVASTKKVASPQLEIEALKNDSVHRWDPRQSAVFSPDQYTTGLTEQTFDTVGARVRLSGGYAPNKLTYSFEAPKEQFVVFSEIFYQPGWISTLDEKEVTHSRVNYLLRGMKVPAGKHTIAFEFRPPSYYTGKNVDLASSLLVLGLVGFAGFQGFKKRKPIADEPVDSAKKLA